MDSFTIDLIKKRRRSPVQIKKEVLRFLRAAELASKGFQHPLKIPEKNLVGMIGELINQVVLYPKIPLETVEKNYLWSDQTTTKLTLGPLLPIADFGQLEEGLHDLLRELQDG